MHCKCSFPRPPPRKAALTLFFPDDLHQRLVMWREILLKPHPCLQETQDDVRDIFGCHTGGSAPGFCGWGGVQRHGLLLSTPQYPGLPPQRVAWTQMSVLQRLRSPSPSHLSSSCPIQPAGPLSWSHLSSLPAHTLLPEKNGGGSPCHASREGQGRGQAGSHSHLKQGPAASVLGRVLPWQVVTSPFPELLADTVRRVSK